MSHGKEPRKTCKECGKDLAIRHFYKVKVKVPVPYKGRKRDGKTHYYIYKTHRRGVCKKCYRSKDYIANRKNNYQADYWRSKLLDINKDLEKYNV